MNTSDVSAERHNTKLNHPNAGLRSRFRDSRPPALAPEPRTAPDAGTNTGAATGASGGTISANHSAVSTGTITTQTAATGTSATEHPTQTNTTNPDGQPSDEDVVRAGGSMAIATLISRITGFLRTVLIGSALGPAVASAFNTANTLPNLITELVLGAVLTSLVVPVLVRAEKEDPDRGAAFIRRLLTITFTLTFSITVISVAAAPFLVNISLDSDGQVNIGMSTAFAYLVLPQIVFYAMFAVFMAVLNTKGVFKPGAWAPVVNNVVTLAILSLYYLLPDHTKLQPSENVTILDANVLLLGLGTTAGVVMQALIMVPYLRKAGIDMRPLWGLDARLKAFGGMAIAIVVYVAISQLGWVINNRIASEASDAAPTIYTQAWQLLQVPYGVIGVTLLTAVMPRLSRNAADGDDKAVVRDLTVATRMTLLALIPIITFFTAFGTLLASALFNYGAFDLETANVLGWTISFSAFTLIPYALVLLHLRVFYAREEVWTPTFIIAGITITKVSLAYLAPHIATQPRLVVVLLGAANGFGFIAGAIIGTRLLRRALGSLNSRAVITTCLWALGASIAAALLTWRMDALIVHFLLPHPGNPGFIIRLCLSGAVFLLITGIILSRSSLPEVMTIGSALSRLPIIGKLFNRSSTAAQQLDTTEKPMLVGERVPADMAAQEAAVANSLLPALPPLSAGRVRGPRLVPGAAVVDGRFRLLADHGATPTPTGSSPAASFWQARETATGDLVALTILDPAAASAGNGGVVKSAMREHSSALAELTGPGLARIRQVIDAPGNIIVVSDWIAGSDLLAVAQTGPDPLAAGYAVADLASAAARTHAHGHVLGLDTPQRVRISTDGSALIAFPGYLPSHHPEQDMYGIADTLERLLENVPYEDVPPELTDLYHHIKDSGADTDPRELAQQLRHLTGELWVDADETPAPTEQAGFGASRARGRTLMVSGAIAFVSVVLIAAVVASVVGFFSGNRHDSPLSPNSLRQGAQSIVGRQPQLVPVDAVTPWAPAGTHGGAGGAGDSGGLDTARTGLLVKLPAGTTINELQLEGLRPGMTIEVRRSLRPTSPGEDRAPHSAAPRTLRDTTLLATIHASDATMNVHFAAQPHVAAGPHPQIAALRGRGSAAEAPDRTARESTPVTTADDQHGVGVGDWVLLWVTEQPAAVKQGQHGSAERAHIGEVTLRGTWDKQDKGADSEPEKADH